MYPPPDTVRLLPVLDNLLLDLLRSLSPSDWQRQTIARQWKVKDVVAHLLDGNIRVLSMLRDDYSDAAVTPSIHTDEGLIDYLNALNKDWVVAMKRVSPDMLILLHETTGKPYCEYYASLDPGARAGFAVNWAGEKESTNRMHIAREYTEKWLHQQQVRDAVGKPGLFSRELFYPFIDTFMMALPHTFRNTAAEHGASLEVMVPGEAGGAWLLTKKDNWQLTRGTNGAATARLQIDMDVAWKLFSKSVRPENVKENITMHGDLHLAQTALEMVSVMA